MAEAQLDDVSARLQRLEEKIEELARRAMEGPRREERWESGGRGREERGEHGREDRDWGRDRDREGRGDWGRGEPRGGWMHDHRGERCSWTVEDEKRLVDTIVRCVTEQVGLLLRREVERASTQGMQSSGGGQPTLPGPNAGPQQNYR